MDMTSSSIYQAIASMDQRDEPICIEFNLRLSEGSPTRDENIKSHFCVYFLPYDAQSKKVFIAHHKKSGLWLSPGGHIDQGEDLLRALNREIGEELGMKNFFQKLPKPFMLDITPICNPLHPCETHYDLWFLVPTNGSDFTIDPKEFHTTKWLVAEDAKKLISDPANLKALSLI